MKYSVTIKRSVWEERTFEVEADSNFQAENIAYQQALDTVFDNPKEADYSIEFSEEIEE